MRSCDETIELWALSLESGSDERALLGARERARADRLVIDDKRAQFIAAQAGLRRVLARYIGVEPASVRFAYGEHGKPHLPAYPGLRFNMTHSGRMALVAVTHDVEIGIDLEWTGRQRPFLRLARRYFTSAEAAWLEGVSEALRARSFYRIWTLKEAYLKAVGTGLTVPPDRFELDLDRSPAALRSTRLPGDAPDAWTFAEPEIAGDHAGAVCWQGDPRVIVRRDENDLADVRDL